MEMKMNNKKDNFSPAAIAYVDETINNNAFGLRFTTVPQLRTGNVKVTLDGSDNEFYWVLYLRENGKYLWRRVNRLTKAMHPLNMNKREKHTKVYYTNAYPDGFVYNYTTYNVKMSEFATLDEALNYFTEKYMKTIAKLAA